MAGDRGLAFVMAGMIGVTALWAGSKQLHRVQPATGAYYAAPAVQPAVPVPAQWASHVPSPDPEEPPKARLAADVDRTPLD